MIARVLQVWLDVVLRFAPAVLVIALASAIASGFYVARNLGVNTDTADMISDTLPWRQHYIAYTQDFPDEVDTVLAVVRGLTPELAEHAAARLSEALQAEGELAHSVYRPGGEAYFKRNGLLFMEAGELDTLTDRLARVQPFLATLARDPSVGGLADLIEQIREHADPAVAGQMTPLLDSVAGAAMAAREGTFHRVSWRDLMLDRPPESADALVDRLRFVEIKPVLDFSSLLPAQALIERIHELADDLDLNESHGVQVRLTGEVAIGHEELETVSRGAGLGALAALVLVSIVLAVGLRAWQIVAASVLTLLVGLIWTAAFAAFAVGQLNLISVAFAVLYIGLGIDAAIHICLRYKEHLAEGDVAATDTGTHRREALRAACVQVGASLWVCTLTTGVGFLAFVPTNFAGLSELGVIAGGGMFVALIASLSVLPALLALLPTPASSTRSATHRAVESERDETSGGGLQARRVLMVSACVALIGLISLAFVRFDENPLNLQPPDGEAVSTFKSLLQSSATSPWWMVVSSPDLEAAGATRTKLEALDVVDAVVSVEDFVPSDQETKLERIDTLDLILGPMLQASAFGEDEGGPGQSDDAAPEHLDRLRTGVALLGDLPSVKASALRLDGALAELARTSNEPLPTVLARFERSLFADLPGELESLALALEASQVDLAALPPDLSQRWVNESGRRLLKIFPREDLNDADARQRFVGAVTAAVPQATGLPMVYVGAGEAVVSAFRQAFATAALLIALLLWLVMRNLTDVARVLGPLVLASLATIAIMVALDMPFNFANVIALPLLLGVGVDGGIHMIHRARSSALGPRGLLRTSTARAVLVSTLTTVAGFGNLAFSPHPGTASMGLVLTIGMFMTLVATLVVLPALMASPWRRRASR